MLTRDLFTVANFHTCAGFIEHEVCVKYFDCCFELMYGIVLYLLLLDPVSLHVKSIST